MLDHIGQELGHYRLICKLGSGSFADVHQAEHIYLNTPAAVKLLENLASDDMQNFHNETRTIAHMVHPHIVRILDFSVEQNIPYLVMEYASNGALHQRHPHGVQIPLPLVITYIRQIASALQYAHTYRLIHRDVKKALSYSDSNFFLFYFATIMILPPTPIDPTFRQHAPR